MIKFGNYAFDKSNSNSNNKPNEYVDITETLGKFARELEELLSGYEDSMRKEFKSLSNNNEKWKREHDGESCRAFEEKMWALSAPFEVVKIINRLYVNRQYNNN